MDILKKINFRQGKYYLPLILYPIVLYLGYIGIRFFNIEKAEVPSNKETTEYYNDKLPDANLKGDGIGDKYSNMLNSYGKIKDGSAVENIDRDNEEQKEEYTSQYNDAELAAMDAQSDEAQKSMERLKKLQENIKAQQAKDNNLTPGESPANTADEEKTLEELRRTLEEAKNEGLAHAGVPTDDAEDDSKAKSSTKKKKTTEGEIEGEKTVNEHAVNELPEDGKAEEVVKKHLVTSDYFNTISANEPEHKLIRAIVDEDIKAVDGSRVRLRLLDDIDIGERTITKGNYLYCTMSGFGQQRVKGNIKSVLVDDELVKVSLSIYDTDGMEGLYVPKSSFRETTKDIASSAVSQNMTLSDGTSGNNFSSWGRQALQNAYQKAANAVSKNIKKNSVKIKYGTQVYLINSKEKRNK